MRKRDTDDRDGLNDDPNPHDLELREVTPEELFGQFPFFDADEDIDLDDEGTDDADTR